jgi:hypothetical protein
MTRIVYISGHLDVTEAEFAEHYEPRIRAAFEAGASFVVGDARGADAMAQAFLKRLGCESVTVFHMFGKPRNNIGGFRTASGFTSDEERDVAMTSASTEDLAWIRPGREKSGTAKNLARRTPKPV